MKNIFFVSFALLYCSSLSSMDQHTPPHGAKAGEAQAKHVLGFLAELDSIVASGTPGSSTATKMQPMRPAHTIRLITGAAASPTNLDKATSNSDKKSVRFSDSLDTYGSRAMQPPALIEEGAEGACDALASPLLRSGQRPRKNGCCIVS